MYASALSVFFNRIVFDNSRVNSNDGWNTIGCMSFINQPILKYSNEIRSAVLMLHGEKAHSCYFSRDAYNDMIKDSKYSGNKRLMIIPDAVHTDLYDNNSKNICSTKNNIPISEKYLLTIQEASAYFNIGVKNLRRMAENNKGKFAFYMGNRYLIVRAKFEAYIEQLIMDGIEVKENE